MSFTRLSGMQLSAAPPRPLHERGCLSPERLRFGKLWILKNGKCKNCCTLVNPVCTLLQHNWKRMSPAYKCRTPKISLHTKVSGDAVLPWQHSPRRVILVRPFHSLSIYNLPLIQLGTTSSGFAETLLSGLLWSYTSTGERRHQLT